MRSQRGFTLIELMIVVAIVGVMSSVAMYALSGSSNAQNTAALARNLQFAMQRARTESVNDNKQRQLSCDSGSAKKCSYLIATTTGMSSGVAFAAEGSFVSYGKHAQVWNINNAADVGATNAGSLMSTTKTVTFYPDGTATAATIYVADTAATTGHKFKVYVYPGTGMARLVDRW